MIFTLSYYIDDVTIVLSVNAHTPEEGESRMKKCVSKMLRNFPVGHLFNAGDWNNAPVNLPLSGGFSGPFNPNTVPPPSGWQQGQFLTADNVSIPNSTGDSTGAIYTVTGLATQLNDGSYTLSGVSHTYGPHPSPSSPPLNGTFTLTASGGSDVLQSTINIPTHSNDAVSH